MREEADKGVSFFFCTLFCRKSAGARRGLQRRKLLFLYSFFRKSAGARRGLQRCKLLFLYSFCRKSAGARRGLQGVSFFFRIRFYRRVQVCEEAYKGVSFFFVLFSVERVQVREEAYFRSFFLFNSSREQRNIKKVRREPTHKENVILRFELAGLRWRVHPQTRKHRRRVAAFARQRHIAIANVCICSHPTDETARAVPLLHLDC